MPDLASNLFKGVPESHMYLEPCRGALQRGSESVSRRFVSPRPKLALERVNPFKERGNGLRTDQSLKAVPDAHPDSLKYGPRIPGFEAIQSNAA